jgi:hypothetical protein
MKKKNKIIYLNWHIIYCVRKKEGKKKRMSFWHIIYWKIYWKILYI